MTCKDCKHFYNREQKPWRTDKDLGYCDHSREGKIEINKYCPVNKWCDNKFECRYTCSECVHIKPDEDEDRYHCEQCIYGDTYVALDCPANRWCRDKFEPKEDSWESVSK